MLEIMNRLGNLKATFDYKRRLEKMQEKASVNPENLLFQIRIGDFLARLKKKAEAIAVYEQAAQKFIQKNLFAQAIALKKIISRLEPARDDEERTIVLLRLYQQMLEMREKALISEQESSPKGTEGASN